MLELLSRKLLHKLPAEQAHDLAIRLLGGPISRLSSHKAILNPIKIMGITFPNPVGLAAGFDKNADAIRGLSQQGFGFIEIGTVTPKAQPGNPKPRIFRLPKEQAIINRLGFNNKGLDYLIMQVKKHRQSSNQQQIIGINIGKNKTTENENALADYALCFEKAHQYADYITINISSPNTPGLRSLQGDDMLEKLMLGMKKKQLECAEAHGKLTPIVVKIAPDQSLEQTQSITEIIVDSGMDGIICCNTTTDRSMIESNLDNTTKETGGLSGRPLYAKSNNILQIVRKTAGPNYPIIGVGGIMTAQDGLEKLALGANLIQIYTGFIYHGHQLVHQINKRIKHGHSG